MPRITLPSDLRALSLSDLWTLYAEIARELALTPLGSRARRRALADLEAIQRAINVRFPCPQEPAPGRSA